MITATGLKNRTVVRKEIIMFKVNSTLQITLFETDITYCVHKLLFNHREDTG